MDIYIFLGIKRSISTAYHPQTDRQTERMNQLIEAYLRSYCIYEQNDWASMLAMAAKAYNNSKQSQKKISPFYANDRFEPRRNWPTNIKLKNTASGIYNQYMSEIFQKVSVQLETSIMAMKTYYHKNRKSIEQFREGELVMLDGNNIRAKH